MAISAVDRVIDEIAQRIAERRNVYSAAMDADLALLCRRYHTDLVCSALERLKEPLRPRANWDAGAHRAEVERAIARVVARRRSVPEEFADDGPTI
jgi:hypothetical protein